MKKKQQDTFGQVIKQTKRLQRIKYKPSFGKKIQDYRRNWI
jgi:hypothetical protein